MSKFVIYGGEPLSGTVSAGGSKNAVLPIIFAALGILGISVIENVPEISDVNTAVKLARDLGAIASFSGRTLTLDTRRLHYKSPNPVLCSEIRASTYLIGASLSRFGKAELSSFGGCSFEPRPIDFHIYLAECMGAKREGSSLYLTEPRPSVIHFKKPSVGATANALILASSLPVTTEIYSYAKEPHIKTLAEFLTSAGACIEFFEDKISVKGAELKSAHIKIPPDPIETGTYLLLSFLSGGKIKVKGTSPDELSPLLAPFCKVGAVLSECADGFSLGGELQSPVNLCAAPYPALPTDLQPLTVPVLAKGAGGVVKDTVFPNRFGYISALRSFGINAEVGCGEVKIFRSRFRRAKASAPDLRGGAALLFPALLSRGVSVINSAELVMRGYGGITEKLRALGADIREESN